MSMKAAVVNEEQKVDIREKPIPRNLQPKEVLFKVVALGQNPTDWKSAAFAKPGAIAGCDFVGVAHELGSDVPKEVKGQLRGGFVRGSTNPDNGAFAEYVKQAWDLTWVVPSNVTPQQAASAPIPLLTACQAMYLRQSLKRPDDGPDASYNGKWYLVWSGATAVGQYAIQLAKLTGFKVATTASPKKHDLVKSLGADFVVDYKDSDVAKKIREGTKDGIVYGLDCISEKGSVQLAQECFGKEGGHLVLTLPNLKDLPRGDVKTEATLVYTGNGSDEAIGPVKFTTSPEDRQNAVECSKMVTKLFESGKLKPLEVKDIGGLEKIQEGLDAVKNGSHPCKLVHTVSSP